MNHVLRAEIEAVRSRVGFWIEPDLALLRITGPDARSWLQTQVTSDVLSLTPGHGQPSALLDRKGRLQANFSVHRTEDELWLVMQASQRQQIFELLNRHIFIEEAVVHDGTGDVGFTMVQGPRSRLLLSRMIGRDAIAAAELLPHEMHAFAGMRVADVQCFVIQHSSTGEDGFLIVAETSEAEAVRGAAARQCAAMDGREISPEARAVLRIEAGMPQYGADLDRGTLLSETPLVHEAVSFTKGCYLGQEVVARLKAYGSVRKMLMGLRFPKDTPLPPRNAIMLDGASRIGIIKSSTYSPALDAPVALAFLDRAFRTPGQTLSFKLREQPHVVDATVMALPFYQSPSRRERAQVLYNHALEKFEQDFQDEDDAAIGMLEEALLLAPQFEDAYEALGVILSRHHRIDEAIGVMDILARLNPKSVMAHTNLSVFYMKKGNLDKAEEEKAIAKLLESQQAVDRRVAEAAAAAERRRIEADARDHIRMFHEVLEIDPEDPLATFGLGSAHLQLQEYAEAIPHLRRATEIQEDYSAAYLSLGKCHEFLGQHEQARAAYKRGIAVAGRKGDLMPMREMERRLHALRRELVTGTDPIDAPIAP